MMTGLHGKSILVLEDDYLLASDLQLTLRNAGAAVVGPFARARDAIHALETDVVDGALLDINLGRGPSFDVAFALDEAGVPFAFVTGYDDVLDTWRHVPSLKKPVEGDQVLRVVRAITHRPAAN